MPTTTISSSIGIVSPSPYPITRTRSFTNAESSLPTATISTDFTPIKEICFKFGLHHVDPNLHSSLNNVYSEPFEDTVADTFFTDNTRTALSVNVIANIKLTIIDAIELVSQANCTTITPIINALPLYMSLGSPPRRYPLQVTSGISNAFKIALSTSQTTFTIWMMTSGLFLVHLPNPLTFKEITTAVNTDAATRVAQAATTDAATAAANLLTF